MVAVRRIVCATDLTARSDLAVSRAMLLARQTGARLTLVHAVDARRSERQVRAQANSAYVQLLSTVDQGFGAESAAIDIAVRAGGPLDVIAKVASEVNADLVVLAAPQRRRLDSIVGTTAERLLRAIGRPVLVVHREARDSYERVAMAVDLSNMSLPMIQTASRLGVLENAETTLLHATSAPLEGMLGTVGVDQQSIEDYKRGWEDDARLRLQAMLTASELPVERTRLLVRREVPALAIRQVLERQQPQLLTIGASRWVLLKRLLIGSVADSLLRTAMCDVLVIPHATSSSASRSPIRRGLPAASVQSLS